MSSDTIEVKKRETVGSLASRKLRQQGLVPANLYGHGEDNLNLAIRADAIQNAIKHGARLLTLTGDVSDTALMREVQWDTFGIDVLHVDLNRVSKTEKVEVALGVELHGEAPGIAEGGQVNFVLHELTIRCAAQNIPEHLQVNVSDLHLDQAILAGDVPLPEGAEMLTHPGEVVVQVVQQTDTEEEAEAAETEPELIGKEKTEEDES